SEENESQHSAVHENSRVVRGVRRSESGWHEILQSRCAEVVRRDVWTCRNRENDLPPFSVLKQIARTQTPASPPDVRRGSAPPPIFFLTAGYARGSGFAPNLLGQRPHQGHSPNF